MSTTLRSLLLTAALAATGCSDELPQTVDEARADLNGRGLSAVDGTALEIAGEPVAIEIYADAEDPSARGVVVSCGDDAFGYAVLEDGVLMESNVLDQAGSGRKQQALMSQADCRYQCLDVAHCGGYSWFDMHCGAYDIGCQIGCKISPWTN